MKIKVSRVEFTYSESGHINTSSPDNAKNRGHMRHVPFTVVEADRHLREAAWYAPDEGGYHKTGFKLTFEDGEVYEGRMDLKREGNKSLAKHVQDFLTFYGGKRQPPHMTQAQYEEVLARHPKAFQEECLTFLDTYEIVDAEPVSV